MTIFGIILHVFISNSQYIFKFPFMDEKYYRYV